MHTILLVQKTKDKSTRTFSDHNTVAEAMEEVLRMYEKRLKELNPTVQNITYNVKDLHNYVDNLGDLCALV